jgi:hypothetical protein
LCKQEQQLREEVDDWDVREMIELMYCNDVVAAQDHVSNVLGAGTPDARDMDPIQLAQHA